MFSKSVVNFVKELSFEKLPSDVVKQAKYCMLDWLGAVFGAFREVPASILREFVVDIGGCEQATLLPFGIRTSCLNAALVNGSLAHMIEYDDIFKEGIYHPGAPVIAAALAVAEYAKASGKKLIEGIVAGYEVSTRLAQAMNPEHYRYWHTTGTVGAIGAASAASKVLSLSEREIKWALGIAGTMAAGLQQTLLENAWGKPLHAGKAAFNGVMAALLAKRGFVGAEALLEGEKGFIRAMAGDEKVSKLGELFGHLGRDFNILKTTFKYYPSCGHTHSAIDAALELVRRHGINHTMVEEIEISTYSVAVDVAGREKPMTSYEAKFSIAYCVAAAIRFGRVSLAQFEPCCLADDGLRRLLSVTRVVRDLDADKEFPRKRRSKVSLKLRNGSIVSTTSDYRRGDPEKPLTEEQMREKFFSLVTLCVLETKANDLWNRVQSIDMEDNMSLFFSSLGFIKDI